MNTATKKELISIHWPGLVMFTLGFWLSGILLIDCVIIPSLLASGMMSQESFGAAGYQLFGNFNRLELVCAALVLSGCLSLARLQIFNTNQGKWAVILAVSLVSIVLMETYLLTPLMSSMGLDILNNKESISSEMKNLHQEYWSLDLLKLILGATILKWCYKDSCSLS